MARLATILSVRGISAGTRDWNDKPRPRVWPPGRGHGSGRRHRTARLLGSESLDDLEALEHDQRVVIDDEPGADPLAQFLEVPIPETFM